MRTYYAFIIKDSLIHFYRKKPYSLYKILEQIYNLKNNDIVLGYRLLEQVTVPVGYKKTNEYIYSKHSHELSYSRNEFGHIINNLYSDEITLMKIFNSHIKIKSNVNCSTFLNSIKQYNKDIFICDFTNKDYFWIEEINVESIV